MTYLKLEKIIHSCIPLVAGTPLLGLKIVVLIVMSFLNEQKALLCTGVSSKTIVIVDQNDENNGRDR